jgi:hypothetical protein
MPKMSFLTQTGFSDHKKLRKRFQYTYTWLWMPHSYSSIMTSETYIGHVNLTLNLNTYIRCFPTVLFLFYLSIYTS